MVLVFQFTFHFHVACNSFILKLFKVVFCSRGATSLWKRGRWLVEDTPGQLGSMNHDVHGKLSGWCVMTAVYCLIYILLFTQWKRKQENFIDKKRIAQHCITYRMNIRIYWLNALHLSDQTTSLASTMCRFLALYTIARFYLFRHLSIEVNVAYIKWPKNMEKCIAPRIFEPAHSATPLFILF